MKTLSKEQVLRLHNALLETFGGTAGVRDDGLLESALNAPFATFGGQYVSFAGVFSGFNDQNFHRHPPYQKFLSAHFSA